MNSAAKRQFATLYLFEHINLTVTNLDNDFQFLILIGNTKTQRKQIVILYSKDLNFSKGQYPRGGMSTLYLWSLKRCGDGSINL